MTPGRLLALALTLIAIPGLGRAQEADPASAPPAGADSLPRFEAAPISVEVPRPTLTAGGASAAVLGLDWRGSPSTTWGTRPCTISAGCRGPAGPCAWSSASASTSLPGTSSQARRVTNATTRVQPLPG